jgi:predicted nucleotide-binding protein
VGGHQVQFQAPEVAKRGYEPPVRFLGYSTQATNVGTRIYRYIKERDVGVYDWQDPPEQTGSILEVIETAERLTNAGIFLFMSDDTLVESHPSPAGGERHRHIPRDNVVYEAGYFAGKKGRNRTFIILEKGAKLPSDLNGIKYHEITNREDISPIVVELNKFIKTISPPVMVPASRP